MNSRHPPSNPEKQAKLENYVHRINEGNEVPSLRSLRDKAVAEPKLELMLLPPPPSQPMFCHVARGRGPPSKGGPSQLVSGSSEEKEG